MDNLPIEELLELAVECKRDLQNNTCRYMVQNMSLKQMCLVVVRETLRQPSSTLALGMRSLSALPSSLRQAILQRMNKESTLKRQDRFEIVSCLLSGGQISNFNFDWMLTPSSADRIDFDGIFGLKNYCNTSVTVEDQTLRLMAVKSKHSLRSLKQDKFGDAFTPCRQFAVHQGILLSFVNLQYLQLKLVILDKTEFNVLGSTLVNLVHLECNLWEASCESLTEGLKPMKKLEVFKFHVGILDVDYPLGMDFFFTHEVELNHHCIAQFPQLKIVGETLALDKGKFNIQENIYGLCQSLRDYDLSPSFANSTSQLQHLTLTKPISAAQANWHSNVTDLVIFYSFGSDQFSAQDYGVLAGMDSIKSLTILDHMAGEQNMSLHDPRILLAAFGRRLIKFEWRVSTGIDPNSTGSVEEVLHYCPNLEFMKLEFHCNRSIVYFAPLMDNFGNPQHFLFYNLTEISLDGMVVGYENTIEMLVHLLTAPKLQRLSLQKILVTEDQIWQALQILRRPDVIVAPQLETLSVSVKENEQLAIMPMSADFVQCWTFFIKYICSKAPLLKSLSCSNCREPDIRLITESLSKRG